MSAFRLRPFAGFTPWNVGDRARDWREACHNQRTFKAPPKWFYYGAQRDLDLFVAFSAFRGRAYRAGDAGRRGRR